jgi:stage III sporulation protein AF
MSVLTEIVRNILVIIIMASFLELLLPEGAIRPFVRFAIGLFVLIAVLNPVLGYFFDDSNFQITWWDYQMEAVEEESLLRRGQEINQNIMNHNQSLLKEKLEELEQMGRGKYPAAAVEGDVEYGSVLAGQIAGLVVRVEKAEQIVLDIIEGATRIEEKWRDFECRP